MRVSFTFFVRFYYVFKIKFKCIVSIPKGKVNSMAKSSSSKSTKKGTVHIIKINQNEIDYIAENRRQCNGIYWAKIEDDKFILLDNRNGKMIQNVFSTATELLEAVK